MVKIDLHDGADLIVRGKGLGKFRRLQGKEGGEVSSNAEKSRIREVSVSKHRHSAETLSDRRGKTKEIIRTESRMKTKGTRAEKKKI